MLSYFQRWGFFDLDLFGAGENTNAQALPPGFSTHSLWAMYHEWTGQGDLPTLFNLSHYFRTRFGGSSEHLSTSSWWLPHGPDKCGSQPSSSCLWSLLRDWSNLLTQHQGTVRHLNPGQLNLQFISWGPRVWLPQFSFGMYVHPQRLTVPRHKIAVQQSGKGLFITVYPNTLSHSINSAKHCLLPVSFETLRSRLHGHLFTFSCSCSLITEQGTRFIIRVPVIKVFMEGLKRVIPPGVPMAHIWNLNVVLPGLFDPHFESFTLAISNFSLGKLFLVAVTSLRRVSELQTLTLEEPFFQVHNEKVILRTNPKFRPKVVSPFHLNQTIELPVFFPHPDSVAERAFHALDIKRTLMYYINRAK